MNVKNMVKRKGKIHYKSGSYGVKAFYNTRFELLSKKLNTKNRKKFAKMSLAEKKNVINSLIKKGVMI